MLVRTAHVDDVPELAGLRARWHDRAGSTAYVDEFGEWFRREQATRWWWIATDGGVPVGMVNVKLFDRMPSPARPPSRCCCHSIRGDGSRTARSLYGRVVADDVVHRVRAICLDLPEAREKLTHGAPGFFVGKQFAMLWPNGHHDHDFAHLWCAAEPGAQEALIAASPTFFRPPYVGHRGWIGVRLDGDLDWDELTELLTDAYRCVAPARLVAQLDRTAAT